MNDLKLIRNHLHKLLPIGLSFLHPANFSVLGRNSLSLLRGRVWENFLLKNSLTFDEPVQKALGWLRHSQNTVGSGGVGCYEFYRWTTGYPEVTGYIIPTLWDCFHEYKDADLKARAIRAADWELGIQRENGGFEGCYEGDNQPAVIFNSGQVLRGLIRSFQETRDQRYFDAAMKAARWIAKSQDPDGSWTSANYKGMKRVYDTYVAAPLAEFGKMSQREEFIEAARRNAEFALQHQHDNGWFGLCDNTLHNNEAPITHTICYTTDGLFETGELLAEPRYIEAAQITADRLLHLFETQPLFWGRFDAAWKPRVKFACVTGTAQLGIVLMRFFNRTGDARYLKAALKAVDFLVYIQELNAVGKDRNGGLSGSYPIWGMYCPFKYPSWAAKYFIDLLLLVKKSQRVVH